MAYEYLDKDGLAYYHSKITGLLANKVDYDDLADVAISGLYSDLTGTPSLATVATTGSYNDLLNKPTIPTVNNATLDIQRNGTSVGTFTANASSDKTINITVPTSAADISALPASTKYGASLTMSISTTDYKVTTTLKDQDGNTLGTAQVIDLPLESVVVSGSYDKTNKKIVLTLQNGSTIDIPVGDLISGLQSEITSTNKLSADLVDDTSTTHKFTTAADITKLAGIAEGAEVNVNADWSATSGDAQILNKPALATVATSGSYNDLSNKPTIPVVDDALSPSSTNAIQNAAVDNEFEAVRSILDNKADLDDIPTALPNPNAITFTGASTGTYDGSSAVTINIPEGGGGGTWGSITGTLSNQTDLQTALDAKADASELGSYVKKAGDTMTGQLKSTHEGGTLDPGFFVTHGTSSKSAFFGAQRTDTGVAVGLGVGESGINHGVWSQKLNKWMVYGDSSNVYLNGTAQKATADGSGNTITSTYATLANGPTVTAGTLTASGSFTSNSSFVWKYGRLGILQIILRKSLAASAYTTLYTSSIKPTTAVAFDVVGGTGSSSTCIMVELMTDGTVRAYNYGSSAYTSWVRGQLVFNVA